MNENLQAQKIEAAEKAGGEKAPKGKTDTVKKLGETAVKNS